MFFRMALRNLIRHKRRTILTGLMMVGGFTMISLALGILQGSFGTIIDIFTHDHTGHIQIHQKGYLDKPSLYAAFGPYETLKSKLLAVPGVTAVSPRVKSVALGFIGTKTSGVTVVGIDPVDEPKVTTIAKRIKEGRFLSAHLNIKFPPAPLLQRGGQDVHSLGVDGAKKGHDLPPLAKGESKGDFSSLHEVVVGEGVRDTLGAKVGDEIVLISQGADGSIANAKYIIVGIIAEGADAAERLGAYMTIPAAQEFLSLGSRIHEVAVMTRSIKTIDRTAALITDALGDPALSVEPWQLVEAGFYKLMKDKYSGNYILHFIIMFLVGVGVLNTVLMSIIERTREFGLMKALGERPKRIFATIVTEVSMLAGACSAIGGSIGYLINRHFAIHGIRYPTPVDIGNIRFEMIFTDAAPVTVIYPAALTIGVAVIVSLWPALRAAKIIPVEALRFK